jgi:Ca2+-binding RTX toxin-like protein
MVNNPERKAMINLNRLIRLLSVAGLVLAAAAFVTGAAAANHRAAVKSASGTAVKKPAAKRPYVRYFRHPTLRLLTIEGTKASDRIALRLKAGNPRILQVDVGDNGSADFSFKRKLIKRIRVDSGAGDDFVRIDEINGAFTDTIRTTIAGGGGNDNLVGGSGAELLLGGAGNDSIDGNKGNDVALLGSGDDIFIWDPGDGNDAIEGQDGADTMRFNGANVAEQVDLSANGNRLRFFRQPGNVTMDTAGVERVDFNALGGADVVTVNDLRGTDVTSVVTDLAAALGGSAGDASPDRVIVNATNGVDTINVNGDSGGVKASGLAATVEVLHSEAANDRLEINTLDGTDTVDSSGLAAGAIQLFVDGALVP